MKTNLLLCSLAAALLAGGFPAVPAQAAPNPPAAAPERAGRPWQRLAEKLDLSSDQRAQIKAVFASEKAVLAPLVGAVHTVRKDLRTAIRAGDANETSVRAAAAKVGAAEADLAVERMKLYGQIAPLLTVAQRQQLAELQLRADDFIDRAVNRLGAGQAE